MIRISEIVANVVRGQPFLEEALRFRFLNLTGFAEYVRPYVEKEARKPVSVHAIKMALSRLEIPDSITERVPNFQPGRMGTIRDLSIMSVVRSKQSIGKIQSLFSHKIGGNQYCAIIEGSSEIDVVYDESFRETVLRNVPEEFRILSMDGLSLCSLRLRDSEIYRKGLFYGVTKQLAFHDINIIQVVSTYHELGLIVKNEDLKKTVTVLLG